MFFDRYVTVDWSASGRPKAGKDSIWICSLDVTGKHATRNPRTRGAAEAMVRESLVDAVRHRERVLVGFDFPYAYPSGFAGALELDGPPWRAIWTYLEEHIRDDPQTNQSNRFEVASAINVRLKHHAFWGRPMKREMEHLSARRDQVQYRIEGETVGLSEWREVEQLLRSRGIYPHSTWKLLGAGSVGSQALTGIPVVSRLRNDRDLSAISRVWPFELTIPEQPQGAPAIFHAEIWPSLSDVPMVEGQVKDETQVIQLAKEFQRRDRDGSLSDLFQAAGRVESAQEEGWILGVA
jgi:hypothetical protein